MSGEGGCGVNFVHDRPTGERESSRKKILVYDQREYPSSSPPIKYVSQSRKLGRVGWVSVITETRSGRVGVCQSRKLGRVLVISQSSPSQTPNGVPMGPACYFRCVSRETGSLFHSVLKIGRFALGQRTFTSPGPWPLILLLFVFEPERVIFCVALSRTRSHPKAQHAK